MSRLYVYAVLAAPPRREGELCGVSGEPLRSVSIGGLAVAVGSVPEAPRATLERMRLHDSAVRGLARDAPALLPMRFGETVADLEALQACVARSLPRLRRALASVEGGEQMTLRVPATTAPADRETGPALERATDGAKSAGTRYLLERKRRLELERTPPPELEPLLEHLSPCVRAQRVQRSESPFGTRVSHLVPVAQRSEYRARLKEGLRAEPHLHVSVTGPWPPYAFSDIGAFAERGGDPS